MRLILLVITALAVAACGEQKASDPSAAADAAQAAGVDANTLTPESIADKIVGRYQSAQDARAGLVISRNGKWTETYEGTQPIVSDWRVFAGDQPPAGVTETFTPASRYLEVKNADEVFYYEMGRIAGDGFDMFYTARGNNLSFVRTN